MGGTLDFGLSDQPVDDRIHVVEPRGEIDLHTAPRLGRRLLGLVDEGKTRLVVDLSLVTFIDSTGIGVILNALRRVTGRDGGLVLVCPDDRALRPFQVSGLDGHLRIFSSRTDALRGVGAAAM
jgi:anti-sigma B factor antagonist